MENPRPITDKELADIRRRRPGVRASLACEGMILSPEQDTLIEQMDAERLNAQQRRQRVLDFLRARQSMPHAAE